MPSIKAIFVAAEEIAAKLKKQFPELYSISTSMVGYSAITGAPHILKEASDWLSRQGHPHKVEQQH